MIRKAVGTLMRSTTVAATTNRMSHMLAARRSTIGLPATATRTTSPPVRTNRTGTTVNRIFPPSVSRPQERAIAVKRRPPSDPQPRVLVQRPLQRHYAAHRDGFDRWVAADG